MLVPAAPMSMTVKESREYSLESSSGALQHTVAAGLRLSPEERRYR
jgi:hypothetical protein